MRNWLQRQWYSQRLTLGAMALLPFSWLYRLIIYCRHWCYQHDILTVHTLPVPVIVVGNISVGGVGKSPLVMWLVDDAIKAGKRPGIISRGYGGRDTKAPARVYPDSDPAMFGDEAVMMAKRAGVPVVVCRDRVAAAKLLLAMMDVDVIISDDGLQHYALGRDEEIVVIDGARRHGNQQCLPAGPLREPVSRLASVSKFYVKGAQYALGYETGFDLVAGDFVSLVDEGVSIPMAEMAEAPVVAVTGIGNPDNFFQLLSAGGVSYTRRVFPDHHLFCERDFDDIDDARIVMTEKDAVKCAPFADHRFFYCPVSVVFANAR